MPAQDSVVPELVGATSSGSGTQIVTNGPARPEGSDSASSPACSTDRDAESVGFCRTRGQGRTDRHNYPHSRIRRELREFTLVKTTRHDKELTDERRTDTGP